MSSARRVTYFTQKYVEDYIKRGFAPIPVPAGSKAANLKNWPEIRMTQDEIPLYFGAEPMNVGLNLGKPSNDLTDVDADVDEAATLADTFLPKTLSSGREGSPRSHRWFRSPGVVTEKFKDIDGTMLLEMRSTGAQTLVEPSVHPSGERYMWDRSDGTEITEIDAADLGEACKKIATATIIARHLPEGGRHDYALALAGYLLRPGRLDEETVLAILSAAWEAVGADSPEALKDLEGIVPATARKLNAGEQVVGGPTLDDIVPGIVKVLARWWGWSRDTSVAVSNPAATPPKPKLAEEAYYGLAGDIVKMIEPHSEADPAALLVNVIVAFGNAIGRGSFVQVEGTLHHLKIFAALVGDTSKGRKGTSWGYVSRIMSQADPGWEGCVVDGLSSGEGLINAVRDPEDDGEDDENSWAQPRPEDKRLLVLASEFAQALKHMKKDTNILSPVLRQAWETSDLRTLTRQNPLRASAAHISVIAHITKTELLKHLTETEMANGLANRFAFFLVSRSKKLPRGGKLHEEDLTPLVERLREALEFGKGAGEITWGRSAEHTWDEVYGPLSDGKPGLFGSVVGRAEAQVFRLAALYALMDLSKTIELPHLTAALASWEYAEDSARHIFGETTGNPDADRLHEALKGARSEGMTRTQIRNLFGRNKSAERITQALALLHGEGRAWNESQGTNGRSVERWFAR